MKYISILFLTLGLFLLGACSEDYLDINEDPNRSTSAEPGPIFTGTLVGYSTNRVIDLGPALSTGTQLWSGGGNLGAGVFTSPERYNFSIFTTGNTWRAYYRDIQKDLKLAINNAEDRNNAIAQCEVFAALVYYSGTVLWGDVPFTEALDVDLENALINNLNPSFDDQEVVLNGILDILDGAIEKMDPSVPNSITSNDLIFKGDMVLWRKFAKSLKLRVLMTMVEADPSKAGLISDLVAEGDLILQPQENAEFPFVNSSGNRNPFWETLNAFAGGLNFFYFASEATVDVMSKRNDPRLAAYFTPYPGGGSPDEVTGAPPGVNSLPAVPWVLSTSDGGDQSLVRPDAPDVLFSSQETHFLIAEAIAKGYAEGGLSEADNSLRQGISQAMSGFNLEQDSIDQYLEEEIDDLSTLSEQEAVDIIAEQLWIDCIVRPLEGFVHWRRNEVPMLEVPEGALTSGLFRRLPYPPDEISANSNAPEVLPQVDEKMWFDL